MLPVRVLAEVWIEFSFGLGNGPQIILFGKEILPGCNLNGLEGTIVVDVSHSKNFSGHQFIGEPPGGVLQEPFYLERVFAQALMADDLS
jgi:hypothetical protein